MGSVIDGLRSLSLTSQRCLPYQAPKEQYTGQLSSHPQWVAQPLDQFVGASLLASSSTYKLCKQNHSLHTPPLWRQHTRSGTCSEADRWASACNSIRVRNGHASKKPNRNWPFFTVITTNHAIAVINSATLAVWLTIIWLWLWDEEVNQHHSWISAHIMVSTAHNHLHQLNTLDSVFN